ncbi:MAG: hypothetical protein ACT4UQ_03605 [Gammaproteobacteria bacterium]
MNSPIDRRTGRRQLLWIAAIFFVPLAAAMWLYFSAAWRAPPGAQHGELIDPPRPLAAQALRGRWFLVYLARGACGADCVATLTELGRVRLALDKDMGRVRRVLLHDGDCCDASIPLFSEPDLLVLAATGTEGQELFARFPPPAGRGPGIYVVDPHGNLLMGYPSAGASHGLLRDLERLLRLSRIG